MIKVVKIYDTQDNTSHLENKQVLFSNSKDFLNRDKGVFEIYHGIKNNKHIGYGDDFWGYDYIAEIECDCKLPVEQLEEVENNLYEEQRNMITNAQNEKIYKETLEKCDACNKEFKQGETYSVMNYHEHCMPKKERGCRYFLKENEQPELILCGEHRKVDENTSDGYHTFKELYEHRHALFCALSKMYNGMKIKSRLHDNGTMYDGWFVAGIATDVGLIDYHLPISWWDKFEGEEHERFITFDGHTPNDVLQRLKSFEVKKESKVYHAANCEEAGHLIFSEVEWFRPKYNSWEKTTLLKIKNLDIYDEVLNGTNCFRLKSINSSGYFDVSIIRECEQPEEKVREVTIEDVREKFIERYVSKNVFLSEEKDHACVKIDKIDFCCGLDNLFGEKVVVKND